MKQLVCEMCGGTDLIKQDGVFVCQSCGTKYSVEEAKKMMIEGTVDVSGSRLKIDTSEELANLYQIARRAKNDNNSESAAKYYDMILVKDPTSWEAYFYSTYYKAASCKIGEIAMAANSVTNCLENVFRLISDTVTDKDEKVAAIEEVRSKSITIVKLLRAATENHYSEMVRIVDPKGNNLSVRTPYNEERLRNDKAFYGIHDRFYDALLSLFENDETVMMPYGIELLKIAVKDHFILNRTAFKELNKKCIAVIQKYDPKYEPPKKEEKVATASSGGCYIATAVYGSYDCPQVWTLRRYRDYTLAATWYGRAFIHCYYSISPTLVRWFGKKEWFKKPWRKFLDCMITNLKSKGIKDTPYEDKRW